MKKMLLLTAALAASSLVVAQEFGRVISSTPIVEQIGVPRQVCNMEQVSVQQPKSGAGALMGAVAGGAMGNAVGDGGGRAVATMIGLMGGAILGDRIEGGSAPQAQNVQRCSTQTFYENRPVAYNVVYEYAGKQYSVQLPQDPGPTIALQVTPVGASTLRSVPPDNTSFQQPVLVQPPSFVVRSPLTFRYDSRYERRYTPTYPVIVAEQDEREAHRHHRQWR